MKGYSLKRLLGVFLSNILLIGFVAVELPILIAIWLSPTHTIGLYEGNIIILALEIALCISIAVWAIRKIAVLIKEESQILRQQRQTLLREALKLEGEIRALTRLANKKE